MKATDTHAYQSVTWVWLDDAKRCTLRHKVPWLQGHKAQKTGTSSPPPHWWTSASYVADAGVLALAYLATVNRSNLGLPYPYCPPQYQPFISPVVSCFIYLYLYRSLPLPFADSALDFYHSPAFAKQLPRIPPPNSHHGSSNFSHYQGPLRHLLPGKYSYNISSIMIWSTRIWTSC